MNSARYTAYGRDFDVFPDGRIVRCEFIDARGVKHSARELTICYGLSPKSYPSVYGAVSGVRFGLLVHRLLAECFIPREPGKEFVNHKDGNKANFDLENLEWVTAKENVRHAIENGLTITPTSGPGMASPAAKLTDQDVIAIKLRLAAGESPASISQNYPVGRSAISEIKAGRSWSHVSVEENAA